MSGLFYANFGVLTCSFSHMEADLRNLISGISFRDESVTAAAFLARSQLAHNIGILKKLSRQLWDERDEFDDIVRLLKDIREVRNLFIHGIWRPGNIDERGGKATVTDLRTTYEERGPDRMWSHRQNRDYTLDDFEVILTKINAIRLKIQKLRQRLEADWDYNFGYHGSTTVIEPSLIRFDDEN